jgi:hypothetical protein
VHFIHLTLDDAFRTDQNSCAISRFIMQMTKIFKQNKEVVDCCCEMSVAQRFELCLPLVASPAIRSTTHDTKAAAVTIS